MSLCTEAEVARMLPLVNAQRRETALKYRHTFGQWASLKSWLMLAEAGVTGDWKYNEYGKPYIENGPKFSLSHCKHGIAVAVDEKPIGIDIESIRAIKPELVARTMNEEEQKIIGDSAVEFTKLWTQKEAYLKYLGTGIIDDLQHVLAHTENVHFETTVKEDYIYTVCYSN